MSDIAMFRQQPQSFRLADDSSTIVGIRYASMKCIRVATCTGTRLAGCSVVSSCLPGSSNV